jgi:hypothetical protein
VAGGDEIGLAAYFNGVSPTLVFDDFGELFELLFRMFIPISWMGFKKRGMDKRIVETVNFQT